MDKRYRTVKILIDNNHVKTLVEIFDTIPLSVVAKDFGTNYTRFDKLVSNPELFRLKELYTIAELFDVDEVKIIQLAHSQYLSKKGKKRKS